MAAAVSAECTCAKRPRRCRAGPAAPVTCAAVPAVTEPRSGVGVAKVMVTAARGSRLGGLRAASTRGRLGTIAAHRDRGLRPTLLCVRRCLGGPATVRTQVTVPATRRAVQTTVTAWLWWCRPSRRATVDLLRAPLLVTIAERVNGPCPRRRDSGSVRRCWRTVAVRLLAMVLPRAIAAAPLIPLRVRVASRASIASVRAHGDATAPALPAHCHRRPRCSTHATPGPRVPPASPSAVARRHARLAHPGASHRRCWWSRSSHRCHPPLPSPRRHQLGLYRCRKPPGSRHHAGSLVRLLSATSAIRTAQMLRTRLRRGCAAAWGLAKRPARARVASYHAGDPRLACAWRSNWRLPSEWRCCRVTGSG